jgi:hypothetical protein
MKNNFNQYLYALVLTIFIVIGVSSCSKDTAGPQVELSYKMLSDKTWFLDYVQTINGSTIRTQTYLGQASYFINFLKDKTTLDSDGIVGTYSIEVVNGKIFVKINAKTKGGNPVSYDYTVESMGAKVLIMSFENSGTKNKFYYSAK